ncbi:diphthamide biosynthesis protein 2-related domain containing protein, putative [Babesia bigemina]|uniref:2-(3-amino-3-carboxypropyl)histidine synthase subunit 1 n=1 Tax=Babesia bigemina TaxID=5866 RepID=A0A061DE78_BABBI|nr:diphthamide biosynthesis protein 2-related domain containing protein, putative [Babesia bigemina]CDR96900.1 diphthamide biosynthesis protein 2-related domain containing protein, putative [Babesia bigemina]|eukprot:XP_012769086.1 diphthamide biosynthesis protein 2-related domain containing protein, putative [Babesia bigemina]
MDLNVVDSAPSGNKETAAEADFMDQIVKKALPSNYNFEIAKSVAKVRQLRAKKVALQMPEGLLSWGCEIADILKFFCESIDEVIIMADVTYGACCIDDITAQAIGCDLIIHYGHSCLVPVTSVTVQCLYVFVEINFSPHYLAKAITQVLKPQDKVFLMGTIQYSNVLREAAAIIDETGHFSNKVIVPQVAPLLPGEVLGCTSPVLHGCEFKRNERATSIVNGGDCACRSNTDAGSRCCMEPPAAANGGHASADAHLNANGQSDPAIVDHSGEGGERTIVFVADGRFHLESALIQNPGIRAYRFDPFNKTISEESYDLDTLHSTRGDAIQRAKSAKSVCLVLSMLGRQGNINILKNLTKMLETAQIEYHIRLLSEITLDKLAQLDVDAYIQIGCPRLSIDWGAGFGKPLLNPYEAYVAYNKEVYKSTYPMDYYSNAGGQWSNYTANRKGAPPVDSKEAIRRMLQQRARAKHIEYSQ